MSLVKVTEQKHEAFWHCTALKTRCVLRAYKQGQRLVSSRPCNASKALGGGKRGSDLVCLPWQRCTTDLGACALVTKVANGTLGKEFVLGKMLPAGQRR